MVEMPVLSYKLETWRMFEANEAYEVIHKFKERKVLDQTAWCKVL